MRVVYAFFVFVGIVLLILPLAVPIIKTSAEFSMFNTKWDGCSEFARLLSEKGSIMPIFYTYNSARVSELEGTLVVIGPNIDFSSFEAEEVRGFLENGGTLFIADDFGTANSLLEKLGVKARFSTQPLKDIFYSKRAEFPVVVRIEDPELAVGVERVTLNIPSAIVGGGGEVFSSKVSVVGKSMRSYPIMAEIRYGKGRIVMLSDPSILINDMYEENKPFEENLVEYLGSKFYFDEAHHSDFNPYSQGTIYLHRELDRGKAFQIFVGVAALAIFVESGTAGRIVRAVAEMLQRFRREENIFEGLPEWVDREILERIVEEMRTGSKLAKLGDAHGKVSGKAEEGS